MASQTHTTVAAESAAKEQKELLNAQALSSQASQDSAVREQLELVGRGSDGEVFPVAVTLSQFKVNSKVYFGTYIRDITYTKNIEMQVCLSPLIFSPLTLPPLLSLIHLKFVFC